MAASQGEGDLIAAIYDSIIEPAGWDGVVKRIVEATKSVSGNFFIHTRDTADLSAVCNADPFYSETYVQHYHKINPLLAVAETLAPGEVRSATYLTRTDAFKASAMFNEWMWPQKWADVVGVGLLRTPKEGGLLVLHRSPDAVWMEPPEWNLLETLAPHLKRAATIHELFVQTRATTSSLAEAVAAAGYAVFLLTGDCRVVFANAKAEDLLRRGIGLRYERGRLAATSPSSTARLHALVRQGVRYKTGEGDSGGTLELCRGENRPPLVAHVIPLAPIRTMAIFDLDRPAAAVFIVDPAADPSAQIQHFAARFGLTAAETRVLAEIIAGKGLFAAAARLKITKETARTQAKVVLSKTGTNRQTELIRRFFETALPGPPSSD
ncbi:MAG: helix-turn-helix transcriptional regulator [Gammaproteobacteria bacterium]